jgi:hypothetical protein
MLFCCNFSWFLCVSVWWNETIWNRLDAVTFLLQFLLHISYDWSYGNEEGYVIPSSNHREKWGAWDVRRFDRVTAESITTNIWDPSTCTLANMISATAYCKSERLCFFAVEFKQYETLRDNIEESSFVFPLLRSPWCITSNMHKQSPVCKLEVHESPS